MVLEERDRLNNRRCPREVVVDGRDLKCGKTCALVLVAQVEHPSQSFPAIGKHVTKVAFVVHEFIGSVNYFALAINVGIWNSLDTEDFFDCLAVCELPNDNFVLLEPHTVVDNVGFIDITKTLGVRLS
eukprot:TRINITY_DN1265_c0_g1_i3.p1 TRINITY_DN1265_c0_g1~~TRINITY_DN1265_c0_g1_i3.p1  ORF type:complete len:128 (+),score=6.97 TRINITY_DN1265_c0_g1_i3:297-680(+)